MTLLWQRCSDNLFRYSVEASERIEREFDPAAVRRLKAGAEHDITVDGPELAAQAIRAGLVGEFQMIICPVVVGGGKRFFPDGVRLELELVEERRFGNGVVVLRCAFTADRSSYLVRRLILHQANRMR